MRDLIASLVVRLPNQCPADAKAWADRVSMQSLPWFPQSPGCRTDSLHKGVCRCGRLGPGMDAQTELHDLGDGYLQAPRDALDALLRHEPCGSTTCQGDCEGEYDDGPRPMPDWRPPR